MKKNLIALSVAIALSIGTTAFAAAPGFGDVPAKHWAYDAVVQLSKAGVVDGYGDNTFRGDKTMTRYEMAVITAKAIAKYEQASVGNKKTIDKLSIEFASELNTLGARVAKLEKEVKQVKTAAEKITFSGSTKTEVESENGETGYKTEVKLVTTAKADDRTTVQIGINYENKGGDDDRSEKSEIELENMWVQTKLNKNMMLRMGSQSLELGSTGMFLDCDGVLGAKLSWQPDKKNDFEMFVGRDVSTDLETWPDDEQETAALRLDYLRWQRNFNKGNFGVYYARQDTWVEDEPELVGPKYKWWSAYASYDLSKMVTLNVEGLKNTTSDKKGITAELEIGKAKKVGEWKHTLTYINAPVNLVQDDNYTNFDDYIKDTGFRGIGFTTAVRLSKASVLSVERMWGWNHDGDGGAKARVLATEFKLAVKF